jgi:hypothetical protein
MDAIIKRWRFKKETINLIDREGKYYIKDSSGEALVTPINGEIEKASLHIDKRIKKVYGDPSVDWYFGNKARHYTSIGNKSVIETCVKKKYTIL